MTWIGFLLEHLLFCKYVMMHRTNFLGLQSLPSPNPKMILNFFAAFKNQHHVHETLEYI